MPRDNKDYIRGRITELIKEINTKNGIRLSYKEIYNQVRSILSVDNKEEQENAFVAFHFALTEVCWENNLSNRIIYSSNPILGAKYRESPAMVFSISKASTDIKRLTNLFLELIDPVFAEKYAMNEKQLDDIYTYQLNVLKSHNYISETPKCLKEWNHRCYREDMNNIEKVLKDHTYTADPESTLDITVAESYYKVKLIKDELDSHGPIWKFFNLRKVAACKSFIKKVNNVLSKCNFDAANHGTRALEMLETTIKPPVDNDLSRIKDELAEGKEIYRRLTTERIFVGQKKAALATKLDNNPETSFAKMLVVAPPPKNDENPKDKNANKNIVIEKKEEERQIVDNNVNEEKVDELKLSDNELNRIGNEMFKIGFRPSKENMQNELAAVNEISRLMRCNPAVSDEAKRIFNANRNKIMIMKNAASPENIEKNCSIIDQVLQADLPQNNEYKTITVEELKRRES